jgi:hypothetical protein
MSSSSLIKTRTFYVAILIVLVIITGLFQAVRQARDLVPLAATTTGMRRKEEGGVGVQEEQHEQLSGAYDDTPRRSTLKIAILLSYVPSGMWGNQRRMDETMLDMVVNKACYAKIWGYDLIFNTTDYFGDTYTMAMARRTRRTNKTSSTTTATSKPHWLEWGAWNRVPHMQSLFDDYAYDWVFYADLDLIIRDQFLPLESFIYELEAYHKTAASVIVGVDAPGTTNYPFSSFALLMKNVNFSHRVLYHWMEAAYGLCPNGNFPDSQPGKYRWEDSDQPGLWYALMKAHNELQPDNTDTSLGECDNATGLLAGAAPYAYLDKFQKYFEHYPVVKGTRGQNLANVPNDQPLLFSVISNKDSAAQQHNNRPLAVQGQNKNNFAFAYAFALHTKNKVSHWYGDMPLQLQQCKEHLGCYANYTHDGKLQVGCYGVSYL